MTRRIADYAILGDTHSTALVSRDGSIDWLCWPRHDSAAVLTRLLDEAGGAFASCEIDNGRATGRSYLEGTNILETRFAGASGDALLTDLMPIFAPSEPAAHGPDGEASGRVLRVVSCTAGEVRGMFRLRMAGDYGRVAMTAEAVNGGILLTGAGLTIRAQGSHAIVVEGGILRMSFRLAAGEKAYFTFTNTVNDKGVTTLVEALSDLERTRRYWKAWSDAITYDGEYRAHIVRSALVLKLLTYAPTGAIVAAPTTSLPEAIPGNRNFDYRYSWVRDSSFTVTAFCTIGLKRESAEYLRFLHGKDLKLVYAIDGEVPDEQTLEHLPGWLNVGPVRIGNAATKQKQHDIYGEIMLALHTYLAAIDYAPEGVIADGLNDRVRMLAEQAIRWRDEPDAGIWELRSAQGHLQHSKALLWVALDRAVKTAEKLGGFADDERSRWRAAADDLRAEYEREAWNEERGAWMQGYGSNVLDAAVLRTVVFGALDAHDPRTARTLAAVERELADGDLVYRYAMADDGFEGKEATFAACAFWRVGVLALSGKTKSAKAVFERLLARSNDVGLFAEEIDAATGEQRGNFPQAFTHMCVINHAVRLEDCIDEYGLIDANSASGPSSFFAHDPMKRAT